ncbi:hypothetical protein MY5147_007729 [Beauveria neobassiana]|uniref:Uncharacterized protein n=1 Tax=Beauveria bassiana D1-5 TaxID=1245745 RepID=A0A0A2VVI0_BEABA|nr:hypothetical protein BBAD15_g4290 [Beauveria bassiana D1-5]
MSGPSSVHTIRQPRDTGFPEPFSSRRNTTLPHPDADLSPNACIGQDDVHADLVMRRSTLPFLHRSKKHKKTLGHGTLPIQLAATPSAVSLVPSTAPSTVQHAPTREGGGAQQQRQHSGSQPSIIETPPSPIASKHARDSIATTTRDDEETPPTSPDDASTRSSRGLFGKLHRHH